MRRALTGLSVAVLALAGAAFGQEGELPGVGNERADGFTTRLDSVMVTGLRPVDEVDLIASVTVLDARDLAVRGSPYLADQLRAVPGIGVSRSGASGGLTQVRIRGAEANHTLVLLDGIEVSDPNSGATDFGLWSGLDAARVEIARGEQSALYGSDAIGGVINVISGDDPGLRGRLEAGSRATYRADAGYGWDFGTGNLALALAGYQSGGVDTAGLGGEKDGSQNYFAMVRGGFQLGRDWRANGLARYSDSEVETDPDLDFNGRLDNGDRVSQSQQWILGAVLQGDALGFNHAVRASYSDITRENFADGAATNQGTGERTKLSYSPSVQIETDAAGFTLSGLLDWEREDYSASDVAFGGGTNQSQSFDSFGLAAEARVRIAALALNASVRRDNNDGRFDDAATWRVGGAYSFAFGGKLRASAGTGVKNPTFTELFGFFPGSFVGNPNLKPETSTSWEIGWDQSYGAADWSLTYFSAALEDEIFTDFSSFPFTANNRPGDSERSGVEFAAGWSVSDTVSLSAAVTNISSQNDSDLDEIRVPEWTGSFALDWRSQSRDGLRAGLALDYVGTQLDTDFGSFQTVELDPYWLVSATAEYPVSERLSLTLRGENLLDETVTDVFGFNGPGAGIFIGITVR